MNPKKVPVTYHDFLSSGFRSVGDDPDHSSYPDSKVNKHNRPQHRVHSTSPVRLKVLANFAVLLVSDISR
jgi:hypothetical protein